jgi:hypothetical protein
MLAGIRQKQWLKMEHKVNVAVYNFPSKKEKFIDSWTAALLQPRFYSIKSRILAQKTCILKVRYL